jgi:hypothetical protein
MGEVDLGEGMICINPHAIEEITVLKAGAAVTICGQIVLLNTPRPFKPCFPTV